VWQANVVVYNNFTASPGGFKGRQKEVEINLEVSLSPIAVFFISSQRLIHKRRKVAMNAEVDI
jgi:hypothetical protein